MGILALGKTNTKPEISNQVIDDVIMAKARKEYLETIAFLRQKGIILDKQTADKFKKDIINNKIIMEC